MTAKSRHPPPFHRGGGVNSTVGTKALVTSGFLGEGGIARATMAITPCTGACLKHPQPS